MLAPVFHPAMKYAAVPRKEVGIRRYLIFLVADESGRRQSSSAGCVGKRADRENGAVLKMLDAGMR